MSRTTETNRGPLLGALIRIAAQAMNVQYTRWLATSGFEDIQPAHAAAIQPLWEMPAGARITTLAQAARITKQSMSALVDQLEAAGYVKRVEDPDDARAARVCLTTRGRAFGRAVRAFGLSIEADWAERIGEQRVVELRATLELLRTSVFTIEER